MHTKHKLLAVSLCSFLATCGNNAAEAAPGVKPAGKSAVPKQTLHRKAGQRVSSGRRYRSAANGNGFVPPPPALMPSILPELAATRMGAQVDTTATADENDEKPPENPYAKYVRTPYGQSPSPLQTRKGVAVWNPRG